MSRATNQLITPAIYHHYCSKDVHKMALLYTLTESNVTGRERDDLVQLFIYFVNLYTAFSQVSTKIGFSMYNYNHSDTKELDYSGKI